jgi:methyl-accepting chemotaxis protein
MKLAMRLGIGFGALIAVMVAIGLVAVQRVDGINGKVHLVVEDRMPKMKAVNEWIDAVNTVARVLRNGVILDDKRLVDEEFARIGDECKTIDEARKHLEETVTSEEGKRLLERVTDLVKPVRDGQERIIELARSGNDSAAASLLFGEYRKLQGEYIGALEEMLRFQEKLASGDGNDAATLASSSGGLIIGMIVAGVLLAFGIAWLIAASITRPVARCIEIAEKVARGETDMEIRVDSTDEIGNLMSAMSRMVQTLNELIAQMKKMSDEHDKGDIDVFIDDAKFRGAFAQMAHGTNAMVSGHIAVKKKAMACVAEFGRGNFEAPLEKFPGKKAFINETIEKVRANLKALIADADMLTKAAVEGRLATRADAKRHEGDFRKIVQGVNDTLDAVIGPLNVTARYVDDISKGVIPPVIVDNYNGDFNLIKNNLNAVVKMMSDLLKETDTLVNAALNGSLSTRANAGQFVGGWHQLVAGVNKTLDSVLEPINEAASVLDKVSARDLTARVKGDYKGDHAKIKVSLNTAVENLDKALGQVGQATLQVSSAAQQISAGSQSLAQGSNEQASSLEEVSSSLEEMASMTRQNADNSVQAKNLAGEADLNARAGGEAMTRMNSAIVKIKDSSDQTAKIVKTIDEIAMQTNLLALNAAVEAARAGDAGRGFAVVAEEVRNLAQRSAQAAKSTADMIGESVKNADDGVKIAQEVAKSFESIAASSRKVNDLIGEIASASREQSQGIDQVNIAVSQMDKVTQQTAANAEESASSAEELSSQAEELQSMVEQFRITVASGAVAIAAPSASTAHRPALAHGGGRKAAHPVKRNVVVDPEQVIPMNDDALREF